VTAASRILILVSNLRNSGPQLDFNFTYGISQKPENEYFLLQYNLSRILFNDKRLDIKKSK